MKKIIFFLLVIPFVIYAQNSEDLFTGGIDISLIASQIDGDYNVGYHKLSVGGGVYADYNYFKKLRFRSGVFFMPKGARSGSKYSFFITRLNYAELPFIGIYKFDNRFSVSLGVLFDYLFNGYYYDGTSRTYYRDLNIKSFDIAHYWSFNINLGKRTVISLVQNYSLIPITKNLNRTCWYNNMFFYWMFKNIPPNACWWNNVLKISLQYRVF